jgi:hypothetical protein
MSPHIDPIAAKLPAHPTTAGPAPSRAKALRRGLLDSEVVAEDA